MSFDLVSIDLDGTLIFAGTACQHMAERLGHSQLVQDLETAYQAGEIGNREFADGEAAAYAGRCVAEIERIGEQIPLIDGALETVQAIHRSGARVFLATLTWTFVARVVARRLAMDGYCGTEMAELDGVLVGRVARYCDAHAKADAVADFAACAGHDLARCAAIGDSRSDLPIFQRAGRAIAFNATADARAAADVALGSRDMRDVLVHLSRVI